MREKGPKLDPDFLLEIYDERDSIQDEHMILKSMVWYGMLYNGNVWKVWYAMRSLCYAMDF